MCLRPQISAKFISLKGHVTVISSDSPHAKMAMFVSQCIPFKALSTQVWNMYLYL